MRLRFSDDAPALLTYKLLHPGGGGRRASAGVVLERAGEPLVGVGDRDADAHGAEVDPRQPAKSRHEIAHGAAACSPGSFNRAIGCRSDAAVK